MKQLFLLFIFTLILFSCSSNGTLKPKDLKIGTFKTTLDDSDLSSIAVRDGKFQIETFNQKKDTFHINWKSNFEYELLKKNPKTELDKTVFVVKITGVHNNYYTFRASYKGSNYVQTGKATLIK